jgi:hypothetical protein
MRGAFACPLLEFTMLTPHAQAQTGTNVILTLASQYHSKLSAARVALDTARRQVCASEWEFWWSESVRLTKEAALIHNSLKEVRECQSHA